MLDLPSSSTRRRIAASALCDFYRWKGSDEGRSALWRQRSADEWPAVDAQRDTADIILSREQASMIVSCAPFRVSFAGGGSDIASFYRKSVAPCCPAQSPSTASSSSTRSSTPASTT